MWPQETARRWRHAAQAVHASMIQHWELRSLSDSWGLQNQPYKGWWAQQPPSSNPEGFCWGQGSQPQRLGPGLGGAHLFQVHFGGLSLGTGVQPCQLRTRSAFSNFSCCWGRCAREGPKSGHHLKTLDNLALEIATTAAEGQCCCTPKVNIFVEPSGECEVGHCPQGPDEAEVRLAI